MLGGAVLSHPRVESRTSTGTTLPPLSGMGFGNIGRAGSANIPDGFGNGILLFSNQPNTWANENDQSALGDHFFKETLRLFYRETNHHTLTQIQASGSMCHLLRLPINDEVTEVREHSTIDKWYVEESTPADELARLRQKLKDAQNEIDQLKEIVEGLKGAELREKTHRVLDLERLQTRTNLKLIGSGLVIEALVRDRTLLVQHVLETVVGRLDRIDSATSRHRVFDENVTGHIMGCIQQVMQDASAVNGVVRNMRSLLPGRADRNDLEDVTRLFGEVDTFKKNVEELATWQLHPTDLDHFSLIRLQVVAGTRHPDSAPFGRSSNEFAPPQKQLLPFHAYGHFLIDVPWSVYHLFRSFILYLRCVML
ncbi:hypothetical protein JX266_014163 [Neoarthrinium moseri]|nr:hypothetical protein JX266_014163 [Neoarthrinium moseri]